jgi:hypothetical protein
VTSRVALIDKGFIRRTRELRLKKSNEVDMLIPIGVALKLFSPEEVSMPTSLLYHAFGIRGYEYSRTE